MATRLTTNSKVEPHGRVWIGRTKISMYGNLSIDQLARIIAKGLKPTASQKARARKHGRGLNDTLRKYRINTPLRQAHFLAQIMHESGGFKWTEEIWGPTRAQKRYDTRTDLGNTPEADGDGRLYRGRGAIQLTGKSNYEAYSRHTGKDFVSKPELVATDKYVIDVAGWFWDRAKLNRYADRDDLRTVTKRINGGYNGIEDRARYLAAAKEVLGLGTN